MTPQLSPFDIVIAFGLIGLNAALSLRLGLGLGRSLFVAGARMVVQVVFLAFVLDALLQVESLWLTFAAMLTMAGFAGFEVLGRQCRTAGRRWTALLGTTAMLGCGWLVTLPALAFLVEAQPWWSPRVALPLFGMVAGSAMTALALGLTSFVTAVEREARVIEARLALGATELWLKMGDAV